MIPTIQLAIVSLFFMEEKMINKEKILKLIKEESKCIYCEKKIEQSEVETIEYVKTKLGTEMFFHTECFSKERMKNGRYNK